MAFLMWSGLLWQCPSSCENHLKAWGFLVTVRRWRRVFCYLTLDTACLKCCRPLGCLSRNEAMPQVTPKLKDGQRTQSNVTWLCQGGAVEWCTRTAGSQGSYLYLIAADSTSLNVLNKKARKTAFLPVFLLFLFASSKRQEKDCSNLKLIVSVQTIVSYKEPVLRCLQCLSLERTNCLIFGVLPSCCIQLSACPTQTISGWGTQQGEEASWEVLGIRKRCSVTICGLVKSSGCLQCSLLSSWGTCVCLKTAECGTGSVPHPTASPQRWPQQASSKGPKITEMRKEHRWYDLKHRLAQ